MKVEICSACKGEGNIDIRQNIRQEVENIKCFSCNGTGKVIRLVYEKTIPFIDDRTELYKMDSEIHNILRKY